METKYQQVVQYILSKVEQEIYQKNEALPSEPELADELGVSRVTVRKAYTLLAEQHLIERRKGSGTYLSELALVRVYEKKTSLIKKKKKVAIVFPYRINFFDEVRKSVVSTLEKTNTDYEIYTNDSGDAERKLFESFSTKKYRGVILSPNRRNFDYSINNIELLDQKGLPFVVVGKPPKTVYCNSVYYDDIQGSISCVREFYYRKYDDVIHVTDTADDLEAVAERREGYAFGMEKYYPQRPQTVFDLSRFAFFKQFQIYLAESAGKLGILLYDIRAYAKLIPFFEAAKKEIGKDVGVIGYNSPTYYDTVDQEVSSIEHDTAKLGEKAVELLEYRISSGPESGCKHFVLCPKLFVRNFL